MIEISFERERSSSVQPKSQLRHCADMEYQSLFPVIPHAPLQFFDDPTVEKAGTVFFDFHSGGNRRDWTKPKPEDPHSIEAPKATVPATSIGDPCIAGMCRHAHQYLNFVIRDQYNSPLGRWLSRDPLDGSSYDYCGNDPINCIDPLGLRPGNWYNSRRAAARDALRGYNPRSIRLNREVLGDIYQDPRSKKFYSTTGILGGASGGTAPNAPGGMAEGGDWHCHGDYLDASGQRTSRANDTSDAEIYSSVDKTGVEDLNRLYPGYQGFLGTPSGHWWMHDPTKGTLIDLGPLPPPPRDLTPWVIHDVNGNMVP